ncbi:MAG: hypothetical protein U0522_02915 [Candidatus Paceibacterota bacterium]
MSIKDNLLKIKPHLYKFGFPLIILILVAISSFGLGKISANRQERTPIILGAFETPKNPEIKGEISNIPAISTSKKVSETAGGVVIASKKGKNYYFPSCAGAKRIVEENKITFSSIAEAEKAGYKLGANCKNLIQ